MADRLQVYKCEHCGIIVEVFHGGGGRLICCGAPMNVLAENTVEASLEKHVPVAERVDGAIKVKVGSIPHPMEEQHYIEWVELAADGGSDVRFLKPGDAPETEFRSSASEVTVRAYCNLHGLWKA